MELVVFVGLPGAGKTTFYRQRFAATHEHVSKDDFRNARSPERRQRQLVERALSEGRSVVVDNTNATIESRSWLIAFGHERGARVVGYWFDADLKECLERNRRREGKALLRRPTGRQVVGKASEGKPLVPDVAVYAMARRLVPPAYGEGFDALCRVRPGKGDFEVVEIPRDQKDAVGLSGTPSM